MAGTLHELLPRTEYDLSRLASAASTFVFLRPRIDTMRAARPTDTRAATLILRIHSAPTWSTGAKIELGLVVSDQAPDDAHLVFADTTQLTSVRVEATDGIDAPRMLRGTATSALMPTDVVSLKFTQAARAATYRISVSADLWLAE